MTLPDSTVPAGIWIISLTPSSNTSLFFPARKFNFFETCLNKLPRVPSAKIVVFAFKIRPGSKFAFGFPSLSRPLSPVRTPIILSPSYKASTAANPGNIFIPLASHCWPSQRFNLESEII